MEASQIWVKNMEAKQDIRKRVLEKRSSLNKQEWEEKSDKILEKVISHPIFLNAEEIYCYVDFRNEVATRKIIEKCWLLKKAVAAPKIEGNRMEFYYISSWDDLSSGHWGILEPQGGVHAEGKSVCVIMPGAVFDKKRNRIGYGKGYYDSYLKSHPTYKTIALGFELQIENEIPFEAHDILPQMIVTEEQVYDEEFAK